MTNALQNPENCQDFYKIFEIMSSKTEGAYFEHENSENEKFNDSEFKNEKLQKRSTRHNRNEKEKRTKVQHDEKENVIKFPRKRSRIPDGNSMVQAFRAKINAEIGKLKRPKIHRINNFFVLGSLISN